MSSSDESSEYELVKAYLDKKILYDQKCSGYGVNILKAKAWEEISTSLEKEVEKCKTKYPLLQKQFLRAKKKLDSGDSNDTTHLWKWFELMKKIELVRTSCLLKEKNNSESSPSTRSKSKRENTRKNQANEKPESSSQTETSLIKNCTSEENSLTLTETETVVKEIKLTNSPLLGDQNEINIPDDMQEELKTKIKEFLSNLEPTNAIDAESCNSVHSNSSNMQKINVSSGKRKTSRTQASGSRKKPRIRRFPFTLIPMKNNISRCEGCKAFFADQPSKDGKVIQHWELRKFTNDNGELDEKEGNAYYHNNLKCVQRKHEEFKMKHLNSHD